MLTDKPFKTTSTVEAEWQPPICGMFIRLFVKFSATPSTSENLTVTLKSRHGTDYDVELYSIDPNDEDISQIDYAPANAVPLSKDDKILVEYDNTDGLTIAGTIKGLDSSTF